MKPALRRALLPIAVLAVGLPVGIGVVMAMGEPKKASDESAFTTVPQGAPRFARHAEPRWERLATFTGAGAATKSFAVARGAVQWKADWSCRAGDFQMVVGAAAQRRTAQTSSCPDVGSESSGGGGAASLMVNASGPWQVKISQQVDTALEEPPLDGMSPGALLASGRFHSIQNHGEGTVSLYRLPTGRLALRFDKLYVSASPGLRVWLTTSGKINSTLDARQAHHTDAGTLRSTLGSFNQMLPASVSAANVHAVVIWCPTVLIAFAAAPLGP
jgi:hypothetical protein